jgi:hypothetical protein
MKNNFFLGAASVRFEVDIDDWLTLPLTDVSFPEYSATLDEWMENDFRRSVNELVRTQPWPREYLAEFK